MGFSKTVLIRSVPIWVIPIAILMAIVTIWLRLSVIRTTYSINQTTITVKQLQQEKEQQELRYTALRSPRRLEILARTKFGLSQPRSDQMIYLQKAH
ncbi:MAG: hypothetical protein AABZ06_13865 [Bdellovibrionota bacterium]